MKLLFRLWIRILLPLLPFAAFAQTNASLLSVNIVSPTNGAFYPAPTSIQLIAGVSFSNDTPAAVEFFDGSNEIGITTNFFVVDPPRPLGVSPGDRIWLLNWTNDTPGLHSLTATVTGIGGNIVTSAPVIITIGNATNPPPPFVIITQPTNGETFTDPTNVIISVTTDADPTSVNFIAEPGGSNAVTPIAIFLGSVSNYISLDPPNRIYSFIWTNPPAGIWFVDANAVLSNGTSAGSGNVQFTVEKTSGGSSFSIDLASPTNGAFYPSPTNIELIAGVTVSNDTVTSVEFFDGSNIIGIATNFAIIDPPGSPGLPTGGRAYFLDWSNQTPGVHLLTATASDTNGQTKTSSPVIVTIGNATPPPPPVVTITEPSNGAVYTAPATIPIDALVYDPAGNVAYVSFRATFFPSNNNAIATKTLGNVTNFVSEPPDKLYSLVWSNAPAGTIGLSAIAVSSNGSVLGGTNVNITIGTASPPPFSIDIASPTNGSSYPGPTNIQVIAGVAVSNDTITSVEFFDGSSPIGVATNFVIIDPPGSPGLPAGGHAYFLNWKDQFPGVHHLTATALDTNGQTETSSPVLVTIGIPTRPPLPTVTITQPTNGQIFTKPANIWITVDVSNAEDAVSAEFYATPARPGPLPYLSIFLGTVTTYTSPNPSNRIYSFVWSNADLGTWSIGVSISFSNLLTIGTNVTITVRGATNIPPTVRITSPAKNSVFRAPVNIDLLAYATSQNGSIASVEFFDGSNAIGFGTGLPRPIAYPGTATPAIPIWPIGFPTNLFELIWSNAPVGSNVITALATDSEGNTATSAPVNITILPPPTPPTNRPAIVTIVATDPIAIEGTNCWRYLAGPPTWSNWISPTALWTWQTNCGPKDATFTVTRRGNTNSALTVNYSIGGTASNGGDYASLPGNVTIPAGQSAAMITIVPINAATSLVTKTIVLGLQPTTNVPPDYLLGIPRIAEGLIIDSVRLEPIAGFLPDGSFHLSLTGPDGAWFHIDYSTDLINWTTICTNQVINGSIDFIDPDAAGSPTRQYRAVPIPSL